MAGLVEARPTLPPICRHATCEFGCAVRDSVAANSADDPAGVYGLDQRQWHGDIASSIASSSTAGRREPDCTSATIASTPAIATICLRADRLAVERAPQQREHRHDVRRHAGEQRTLLEDHPHEHHRRNAAADDAQQEQIERSPSAVTVAPGRARRCAIVRASAGQIAAASAPGRPTTAASSSAARPARAAAST